MTMKVAPTVSSTTAPERLSGTRLAAKVIKMTKTPRARVPDGRLLMRVVEALDHIPSIPRLSLASLITAGVISV